MVLAGILKHEMKQVFSEMNIVKKLKAARMRNSKTPKFIAGFTCCSFGYLILNKRVTSCQIETPEIKKSALMYATV